MLEQNTKTSTKHQLKYQNFNQNTKQVSKAWRDPKALQSLYKNNKFGAWNAPKNKCSSTWPKIQLNGPMCFKCQNLATKKVQKMKQKGCEERRRRPFYTSPRAPTSSHLLMVNLSLKVLNLRSPILTFYAGSNSKFWRLAPN